MAAIVLAALASLVGLLAVSGIPHVSLALPYEYQYDALSFSSQIKGMIEHGWYLHNPSIGAPRGQVLYDFPLLDLVNLAIIRVLCAIVPNFAVVENLAFILSFPLAASTAAYAAQRIGLRPVTSFAIGVLYAFEPYHFLRFERHLALSLYYITPLALLLVYDVSRGRASVFPGGEPRRAYGRRMAGYAALAILTGLSGLYYAAMGIALITICSLVSAINRKRGRIFVSGVAFSAVAVLAVLCAAAPSIGYWRQRGMPTAFVRPAGETEQFALTLSQMLLPTPDHRIPALARVRARFEQSQLPVLNNENNSAALGTAGAIGLILIIAAPFIDPLRKILRRKLILSTAVIVSLLWATVGGISAILSLLPLGSTIRATNRVSIFIAFYALCGLGAVVESLARRRFGAVRPGIAGLCACVVVAVCALDQCPASFRVPDRFVAVKFASDEQFGQYIDQTLPPGAMIFNLPYAPFPEGIHTGLGDYDEFRPYLHTRRVRYSYGTVRGRGDDAWQLPLLSAPAPVMAAALRQRGFQAIIVDQNFTTPDAQMRAQIDQLAVACRSTGVLSPDGSFIFIPIR